ncbi:MAG: Bax inhibitor-1/YccA family protein [Planctomycetota bacterium]|jgi:FtsH-binding integral membrane protein
MARGFQALMQKRQALANSAVMSHVDIRMAFLKRVYKLVGLTAIVAGGAAVLPFHVDQKHFFVFYIAGIIGYFVSIGAFVFGRNIRRNALSASIMLSIFGACTGFILAPLLLVITSRFAPAMAYKIIGLAGAMTILTVVSLSGYVIITKRDFSFLHAILWPVMLGAGGVILLGWIFGFPSYIWFFIAIGMVVLCCLSLLYTTSRVLKYYPVDEPYYAAFHIYADMFWIFYYLLYIIMIIASARD